MSKQVMMFQCEMQQDGAIEVAWIEERGAFVGAYVEVPELGGGWWHVTAVHRPGMLKADLNALQSTKRRGFKSIERTHA